MTCKRVPRVGNECMHVRGNDESSRIILLFVRVGIRVTWVGIMPSKNQAHLESEVDQGIPGDRVQTHRPSVRAAFTKQRHKMETRRICGM